MIDSTLMWVSFFIVMVIFLIVDLVVLNRKNKSITLKRALTMTAFWVSMALAFGIFVYYELGSVAATQYYTAYVIEQMMSVDNLFVFIVIFGYFCVPEQYQHKALFYGIIGAFAFRALFIFAGAELLDRFDWMMYIFGIVLIITAVRTVIKKNENPNSRLAARMTKKFKVCPEYDGAKLFTVKNGVRVMTPLFLCIIVIELTDIMFAFDSIPAALAITTDRFIVYTSNLFAVIGLRSLFFVIKGSMEHMEYLKYGLAVILVFIGTKMILSEHYHVDVLYSLMIILAVLGVTVAASLYTRKRELQRMKME